jgi:hypothetical protein
MRNLFFPIVIEIYLRDGQQNQQQFMTLFQDQFLNETVFLKLLFDQL